MSAEGAALAKILILDDSPSVLAAASMALTAAGHEVLTREAQDGLPALIQREQPALLLLDVNMPAMQGDKTLRALRMRGWATGVKVLLYSAKSAEELEILARGSGADGFVCKVDGPEALVVAVNRALGTAEAEAEAEADDAAEEAVESEADMTDAGAADADAVATKPAEPATDDTEGIDVDLDFDA